MNYSANASVIFGAPALRAERVRALLAEIPDLLERLEEGEAALSQEEGYLLLELYIAEEGEIWDAARALGGFALEAGPDSGGPGWAGTPGESFELLPHNFIRIAQALEAWRRANPPVGEGALEAFLALVREAEREEV
jgi:alkylation response protein AidB-like acyl-CoA dehydrogenase